MRLRAAREAVHWACPLPEGIPSGARSSRRPRSCGIRGTWGKERSEHEEKEGIVSGNMPF
eukprot:2750156-Pleurochrysis_carterae.AAC.2